MKKTLSKQLVTAKTQVQAGNYNLAINILDSLDINNISETLLGEYYLLKAECCNRLGRFDHDYPDKAVAIYKQSIEHEKFGFAKFLKGWQLQSVGKSIEAKSELIESYVSAIRADNTLLACQALSIISYILQKAGQIDQAEENFKKSIQIHLDAGRLIQSEVVKNNLARLYLSCGQFSNALSRFNECEDKEDSFDQIILCNLKLSHSIALAYCGEFDKAFEIISKCKSIPDNYDRLQVIFHEYYGQILMLDGQIAESFLQLHKGLEIALKTAPKSDMISQIERLLGDAYILSGNYKQAKSHTLKALKVAELINEQIEIAACYRNLAQIEHHNDSDSKSREYFTKAITIFIKIKSSYELAVTRLLASQANVFSLDDTTAMLYLAQDYFESEEISHYIEKVQCELQKNNGRTAKGLFPTKSKSSHTNSETKCPEIITVNKKMLKLLNLTKNIAVSDMSVLLTGETGTGKEVIARYIHHHSSRTGSFVDVNSSAFPSDMFESELFGYKKGAFTGANSDKPGLFEMAEGGTFFLDEIGDLNLEFQAKLLRVLDQKSYRRLGETITRKVNFRLIAATNRNLEQMIRDNLFRSDLYFRLKEIELHLPPLRDRKNDLPSLVEYFLHSFGFKTNGDANHIEQLASKLAELHWDGNIRELQNELRRLYFSSGKSIAKMIESAENIHSQSEHEELITLLKATDWNRRETARLLNVSEGTIRRRILKHNILEQLKF